MIALYLLAAIGAMAALLCFSLVCYAVIAAVFKWGRER